MNDIYWTSVGPVLKECEKALHTFHTTPDESYTYDSRGNRLSSLTNSYTYNNLNQLNISGTHTYQYDADGNLGFQSKYYDRESGMYYFYHRYYNPVNGRFLNEDPIGLDGGLNMYLFVYNNPANFIDHFGLDAAADVIKIGWGVALSEPSPVGETIMTVVTVVAGSYLLIKTIFFSKTRSKRHNWASTEALRRAKPQGKDPCDIISEWIKEAKCRGRKDLIKDFITAQKVLGCRNIQKRRSK